MSTALDVFVDGRQRDSLHRTALGKGLPTQRLGLLLAGPQRHTHAGHDTTVIPLGGRPLTRAPRSRPGVEAIPRGRESALARAAPNPGRFCPLTLRSPFRA